MRPVIRKRIIKSLAKQIKAEGLRVFLSEDGEHGFFTNEKGDRVVSFQLDYLTSESLFFGNITTEHTRNICTNHFQIDSFLSFKEMLSSTDKKGYKSVSYCTLEKYLNIYQKSSKFSELV